METASRSMTMTTRDYLRVVFHQKAVIITCVIMVMAAVIIGLEMRTPVYEAKVKMLVSALKQVDSPYYKEMMGGYRGSQPVLTQSEIVKSNSVMQLSVNVLHLNNRPFDYEAEFASRIKKPMIYFAARRMKSQLENLPAEQVDAAMFQNAVEALKNATEVEPIRDTDMFTITVRDYNPVGAAITANVVSRAYVIFDLEQQLAELQLKYGEKHSIVIQMKDNIERMVKGLNGEPMLGVDAIGPASVKIIEQASMPQSPVGLPKTAIVILSSVMSIFLSIMLAFIFEYVDQTLKSPWEIERYLNVPFLGFAPRRKSNERPVIQSCEDSTPYCRALHNISDRIALVMKQKGLKIVMLTSAKKGEGVTTTIANLGSYLANIAGHKVLLIDGNLRNPRLHQLFSIKNDKGLGNILENKNTLDDSTERISGYLSILPSGRTEQDPVMLLNSQRMAEVFKSVKDKYDIILVDAPALRDYQDSRFIALYVDAACAVIKEGQTRRHVIETSMASLIHRKVDIIGAILNNRSFAIPQVIYDRL